MTIGGKEIVKIKKIIKDLTNPHLGSFGEYIFYQMIKDRGDQEIFPVHRGRSDFEVNEILYDVKTTRRWLDYPKDRFRPYIKPIEGMKIVYVFFHQSGCSVDDMNSLKGDYDWITTNQLCSNWRDRKGYKISTVIKHGADQNWIPIKEEIIGYYRERGMEARVIYRTIQREFGNESPGNLIPKKIKENRITVLVLFKDQNIERDNIDLIYAISDQDMGSLPILKRTRLHMDKVDLEKINDKFVYSSIKELMKN